MAGRIAGEEGRTQHKANRLVDEHSPYLLQHADNPVDWHPWGPEAFARAKAEDKPVFLSVGYSTCHWCHVMERESFSRQDVADILNAHFVAIKVDREERPDVDEIYMHATQMMTGRGGWPNSVWLTPDARPWFAGTYFPREDQYGRPGFKTVLTRLSEVWRTRRREVEAQGMELADAIRRAVAGRETREAPKLTRALADAAVEDFHRSFDPQYGGFSAAPKFPPHSGLRLLLDEYRRSGHADLKQMIARTLDAMAAGGIRDHLGGGFHRYTIDPQWRVPHFEKMLYDNAQLIRVYAEAHLLTGDDAYRRIVEEIFEWVRREMTAPEGGFYSAIDADSEGREGEFYLWTRREVIQVLGRQEGKLFCRAYSVTARGNYHDEAAGKESGVNILYPADSPEALAEDAGISVPELTRRLGEARAKLLARRSGRIRPHVDDKVLAGWNGLMIAGLAYAGRVLDEPRYTQAAARAADFVLTHMRDRGRLRRSWRDGQARLNAYLDDYAFLADGLLELHLATNERRWLAEAGGLMSVLARHYADPAGGYYYTSDDHEDLLMRSRMPFDKAIPSGNAVAASVLIRLGRLTGRDVHRHRALKCFDAFAIWMHRVPQGTATMIRALNEHLGEAQAVPADKKPAGLLSSRPHVEVGAAAPDAALPPGGIIDIPVRITIEPGWHVNSATPHQDYLPPATVRLRDTPVARVGPIDYPAGRTVTFAEGDEPLSIYEGTVEVTVPVTIAADAPAGPAELVLEVIVQPCTDRICMRAQLHKLVVPIEIGRR